MIRATLFLGVCGLSACANITDFRSTLGSALAPTPAVAPAPAAAPTVLTAKERLLAAIDTQGCVLDATNVGAVLAAATITREELLQLTPQLQTEGRVAVSGTGSIRSTSATCINV
ncbi:MAG: hypothetical protein ABF248_04460 [Yoonia sp.]